MSAQSKPSYDILLLGKTGHGKSATGNSIIGRRAFKSSANTASVTFDVQPAWTERTNCVVKVIDGPGIGETRLNREQAVVKAQNDLAKAMTMCTEGFHAMIIVYKFGHRFTTEEQDSIDFLKGMLGQDVFRKYGICVMTCGDQFLDAMEEDETPNMTPVEWCLKQDSKFADLLKECGLRVCMFDNKTKDVAQKQNQVDELVRLVAGLPNCGQRYTNGQFVAMHGERQKLILKAKLPQMEEEIQRKCSLLKEALGKIKLDHADAPEKVADLKQKANELIKEIYVQDKGTQVLLPLKSIVDSLLLIMEKFESARAEKNKEELKKQIEEIQADLKRKEKEYEEKIDAMNKEAEDEGFFDSLWSFGKGLLAPIRWTGKQIKKGAEWVGDKVVEGGKLVAEGMEKIGEGIEKVFS